MRDELRIAVQELEGLQAHGHASYHDELENLPENAADEHAGLGFRYCSPCNPWALPYLSRDMASHQEIWRLIKRYGVSLSIARHAAR